MAFFTGVHTCEGTREFLLHLSDDEIFKILFKIWVNLCGRSGINTEARVLPDHKLFNNFIVDFTFLFQQLRLRICCWLSVIPLTYPFEYTTSTD